MTRRYDLLIFDWDGTLADSAGDIVRRMQEAIVALDLPRRADHSIAELIGLGLPEAFSRLFPELTAEQRRALIEDYGWRYRTQTPTRLFDGVRDTLDRLRDAGWQLAIATGKSRRGLARALQESDLAQHFTISRCADETASKPDPAMLDAILLATATEPQRAIMIGDTEYDMQMAANIGMDGLGVACGVHSRERLQQAGARAVLDDVTMLHDWLQMR